MVVLTSVEALSSPSPIIATFARAASANVPAVDDDDEKLGDNEDVERRKIRLKMKITCKMIRSPTSASVSSTGRIDIVAGHCD